MRKKNKFSLLLDSSCPAKFLSETNIPQHVSATGYFPELNSRSLQSNTTNYFEKADMCPYFGFVWDYNNWKREGNFEIIFFSVWKTQPKNLDQLKKN